MDLKLMDTIVCRTPAFSPDDTLEQCWPALKEMISESSPEFYRLIENMDYSRLNNADEKLKFSIWKYFNRARFRATPFGSFAAISFVPVVKNGEILKLQQKVTKYTFTGWSEKDAVHPLQNARWFQTNSTCYQVGAGVRYIRFRENQFELATVPASAELETLLLLCRQKTEPAAIYKAISGFGLKRRAADNLLAQMLSSQLLFTDLTPNITGPDYFKRLNIEGHGNPYIIAERRHTGGGADPAPAARMMEWFGFVKDFIPQEATANMETFRREFSRKFDLRAVPLALAIDPEAGVGYGGLAKGPQENEPDEIIGNPTAADAQDQQFTFTARHRFLLDGLLKGGEIHLEEFTGKPVKPSPQLANTFSAIFRYSGGTPVMESSGGSTANSLLGRFTITGGQAHALGKQIAGIEEKANPDVLFFDVAYQAEKKVDDVNRRQQLYENELPLLSWSCHDEPLSLDDMLLMQRNGELILWSKKYRRRLVPRIASAYNYTRSDLAVYRFLCDLQHQGISSDLTFSFRQFYPGLDYYPRVWYKNIIVSAAMWKMGSAENSLPGIKKWLAEKNIDLPFKCGNGDQTLCFDPRKDGDLQAFLTYRQNGHKDLYITEALLGDVVAGEQGKNYIPQYVAAFFHNQQVYPACQPPPEEMPGKIFYPGSEWLYFEIYCHPLRGNQVLQLLRKFAERHKKALKKWFFLRYTDPAQHLRLRLQVKNISGTGMLMNEMQTLLAPLCNSGLIADIQVKSYSPEYVRYGVARMELTERFFHHDSAYTARLLVKTNTNSELYVLALKLMEQLLLLAEITDSLLFVEAMAAKFSEEFSISHEGYKQINKNFEHLKKEAGTDGLKLSRPYQQAFIKVMNACNTETEKQQLLADIIHMHINRVFYSSQRMHEAILYQYLLKLLKARQFRAIAKPVR